MSSWRTYFPDGIPDDPDEQRRLVSELTDEMCLKDMSTRLAHAQLKEPANKRVLLTIDFQLYGLCIHGPSLRREVRGVVLAFFVTKRMIY
jgi:hypothetical protein